MPGRVSYLVSSYNHLPYIRQCLDAILAESYPDIELLVCDDCSTDGSREFLKEYQREHGFTLLLNERNEGVIRGLNRMIHHATGEYVALMASDDWMEPGRTAAQVAYLARTGHDAVLAPVKLYYEATGTFEVPDRQYLEAEIREGRYLERLYRSGEGGAMTQSGLLRRSVLLALGGFREDYKSEDWLLMIRFLEAGYSLGFLNEAYTIYRIHSSNSYHDALRCLHELQLPVIRDFVPREVQPEALASVYHTCAMKLLNTNKGLSIAHAVRAQRYHFQWSRLRTYALAAVMSLPGVHTAYVRVVRPARGTVARLIRRVRPTGAHGRTPGRARR